MDNQLKADITVICESTVNFRNVSFLIKITLINPFNGYIQRG